MHRGGGGEAGVAPDDVAAQRAVASLVARRGVRVMMLPQGIRSQLLQRSENQKTVLLSQASPCDPSHAHLLVLETVRRIPPRNPVAGDEAGNVAAAAMPTCRVRHLKGTPWRRRLRAQGVCEGGDWGASG